MIGICDCEVQAANPNMPLYPLRAYINSPSSLRIRNVPKKIGDWNITSVQLVAAYPDNTIKTANCKLIGCVWVGTIEGSTATGTSENGYTIYASGIDENGNEVSGYVLGKGLIEILATDGSITPGETVSYVHLLSAEPSEPKDGDLWPSDEQYMIWQDGEAHGIGGMTSAEVSALLDTKQNVLTQAQMNAVNSGINYSKVQTYDNYQSSIEYATLVAENAQNIALTVTDDANRIMNRIPSQTWNEGNELADKSFVNSSVQTATANFRGNWPTWADVPADASQYPADYAGSTTPTVNDYMVVQDVTIDGKEGTWRYKYSGAWATDGKAGWLPEYQVNETPMTAAQLAAINSNITATKVAYYDSTLDGLEDLIDSI